LAITNEHRLRTDRNFWILFAAGWVVCGGLLMATAVVEGEPLLNPLVILFPPLVLATLIAFRRRSFLRPEWPLWKTVAIHFGIGIAYAVMGSLATTLLMLSLDLYDTAYMGPDPTVLPFVFAFYYFMMYAVLAGFMMWSESLHRVEESRALAAREAVLRAEAEAKAVRAQFNPHFLFNTLHSLMLLVRADPAAAERAIEDVAELIRYASALERRDQDAVPLAQELEIARRYLSLESLRLSERLRIVWEIDPDLEAVTVPAFSLQTLLENAIKHGIAPKAEGGTIRIEARRDGDVLEVSVEDDGLGANPEKVHGAEGRGLSLLRSRVSALFGEAGTLRWQTKPGAGFSARLRVPLSTRSALEGALSGHLPGGIKP
jgi:signal transduction histidine kinase